MITLLNNRVKRGELQNASIILNGLENKKYGTGYGHGYGYGNYANGYYYEERSKSGIKKLRENPKSK
jgi:hypothetical protein